jgi:hypothetical protein
VTIVCNTEPMVVGVCAPVTREGGVMPQFFDGAVAGGMSTCPCLRYLISVSHDDLFGRGHVGRLQRLAGRTFGMHITVAMGTAMVRSL